MDFEQAVVYMQGLRRFGVKLGNERFEALLALLGNPHRGYRVVHVAGTKGKGSTTAMIAAMLRAHGFRVGGYYSPYVFDVRERVQVDGEMIGREDFARLVTRTAEAVDALRETDHGQTTEFEVKTAVGFQYFTERHVDYAAVEVGLGGRLDATNVVAPRVTVITNIGLDHVQVLGDTHAKIAAEKAGIIKRGVPLITATDEPSALDVIAQTAQAREAPLTYVRQGAPGEAANAREVLWWTDEAGVTVRTPNAVYGPLRPGLGGGFQHVNAACAVAAVEQAGLADGFSVRPDAVSAGIAQAYLPGRWEVVRERPTVILDGAHNEMAARALAAEVARVPFRRLILVAGMVAGHEPAGVLEPLASMAAVTFATQPTWSRGLPAEEIARTARDFCRDVRIVTPPSAAAQAALAEATEEDLVLVTGSFYTVGDVRVADLR